MGNDGGSIPKRRELVREAAREPSATAKKEKATEVHKKEWTTCQLSNEPLDLKTAVSDHKGGLFNYEAILERLLGAAETSPDDNANWKHLRGLKDVVKLKFTMRKDDGGREHPVCPVSMKELGPEAPTTKAVYIVACGHVFADAALKQITESEGSGESGHRCPECSEAFEDGNVIPILPILPADEMALAKRIDKLREQSLTHSLKKDKSSGKKKKNGKYEHKNGEAEVNGKREKANGIESRINNPITVSLTAKVLAEQEENNKRRRAAGGDPNKRRKFL